MDFEHDLNRQQRRTAAYPPKPLLVLAGPGTGKTRALAYRIASLIQEEQAAPDQILAVTFTNKAAEEMRSRLRELLHGNLSGLWAMTFHGLALRLLREYGPMIGLSPNFVVYDEIAQKEVLIQACERIGWGTMLSPRDLAKLRDFISRRKVVLLDPSFDAGGDPEESELAQLSEIYQDLLSEYRAFDFDDLIVEAARMLAEYDDLRTMVRNRFHHVLVDEGHDMNLAQYRLLQHIAPPGSSVAIFADDNQSIYRWRGAEPRLLYQYQKDYNAETIVLEEIYRSTGHIISAAQHLIQQNQSTYMQRLLRPMREEGEPIEHVVFANPAAEEAWLTDTIRHLTEEEDRQHGDIAILYRTHQLADSVQRALVQAGISVNRIQREIFFEQPGAKETLRYLQLLRSFTDPYLRQAINFPRHLVDELTMLQLRTLAHQDEVSLSTLASNLDSYPEVNPLTRAALRRFVNALNRELLPLADESIDVIVRRLFDLLEKRRSPFRLEELPTLSGFARLLSLPDEVAVLKEAVDSGRPIAIVAPPETDALCAAVLLEQTLTGVLNATVTLQVLTEGESITPTSGLTILVGLTLPPEMAKNDTLILERQQIGEQSYSLSTVAWRLATGLLVTHESLDDGHFVIYDLETTGTSVNYDEILEIGAITVVGKDEVGQPFDRLVRPKRGYVDQEASAIHGLTWYEVKSAPEIAAVLPKFLRYVTDATLVGHNIAAFDNRLLDRDLHRILQRRLTNPTIDTLELARRLLPGQSHSLDALVEHYRLGPRPGHRALADARLESQLFFALMADNRWHKELLALSEMLPLVTIGMEASGIRPTDENHTLRLAAARVAHQMDSSPSFERVVDLLPADAWLDTQRLWTQLKETVLPETADDRRWNELRPGWLDQVETFLKSREGDPTLSAFLDYAALVTEEDVSNTDTDRVTMMTLHNAKGKEFPVVIIIRVEDGNIPDWRNRDDP